MRKCKLLAMRVVCEAITKYICQGNTEIYLVLDPSLESRPYLSALVPSEEATDDESNEVTALPNPQHNQQNNTDEQVHADCFLKLVV